MNEKEETEWKDKSGRTCEGLAEPFHTKHKNSKLIWE